MAPKKRPGERWFELAPDKIWQEFETPQDDSYVPKASTVLAWSVQVVKTSSFKIMLMVKVGTTDKTTWASVAGWEVHPCKPWGNIWTFSLRTPPWRTSTCSWDSLSHSTRSTSGRRASNAKTSNPRLYSWMTVF